MTKQRYSKTLAVSAALIGALGMAANVQAQDAEVAKEDEEKKKWEHTAGLGFTLTGGNAETVLFTADYLGIRKWGRHELGIGAAGGYGKADGEVNNNFVNGFGQYNILFGPQQLWYGFGRVNAQHDEIADIAYRVPIAGGVGYYFLKRGVNDNEKFNLAAEVGPGYAWEKVGGVTDQYATIYAGQRFSWQINEKTRLWQSVDFTPEISDFGNYVVNGEIGVETSLIENLALRAIFTDSYRSNPAAGRKNNDYKFITSIAYKF